MIFSFVSAPRSRMLCSFQREVCCPWPSQAALPLPRILWVFCNLPIPTSPFPWPPELCSPRRLSFLSRLSPRS